jgi:hypothetical protein
MKDWQDFIEHAENLISRGYPVPTDNPEKLAKILHEKHLAFTNEPNNYGLEYITDYD